MYEVAALKYLKYFGFTDKKLCKFKELKCFFSYFINFSNKLNLAEISNAHFLTYSYIII